MMYKYYVGEDYKLSDYLLTFLRYGDVKVIRRLMSIFRIECEYTFKNYNENLGLFYCFIQNKDHDKLTNFIEFFKLIVKSIASFKFRKTKEKEIAAFLSELIKNTLDCKYIYVMNYVSELTSITKYTLNLNCPEGIVFKDKKTYYFHANEKGYFNLKECPDKKFMVTNFVLYSKSTRKSDIKRFLEFYDNFYNETKTANEQKNEYCPVCNPFAPKLFGQEPQCCANCKKAFKLVEQKIGVVSKKRIYDAMMAVKPEGRTLGQLRNDRFNKFKKRFEAELKAINKNEEMLNSEDNTNIINAMSVALGVVKQ